MFIRAYLRASTAEQDSQRAKTQLQDFVDARGLTIASYYTENESGAKLDRPELLRLLSDCQKGDILLVESIDRLTRLTPKDWQQLKDILQSKGVSVVSVDLPTSHMALTAPSDTLTHGILGAVNALMIDIMAVVSRQDYETRRQRQAQGIKKAQAQGKYKGRPTNTEKYKTIAKLLQSGLTHREIMRTVKCSASTIQKAIQHHGGIAKNQQKTVKKPTTDN